MTEIKNLKKAAERIKKAIRQKERIILYGDADLDGVTSVIILQESVKSLGGDITRVYFPDRELEGYGISEMALEFLKKYAPALLITLDCGISNLKEVKLAKKLGFEVIIIDHHEVVNDLPEASIIVDPKQKNDKYLFKGLATAGIIYKLSQLLLKEKLTENLENNFLELAALATIADMMPEADENKIIIERGLNSLENTWRPGLKAFFNIDEIKQQEGIRQMSQKIISVLNITEIKDHLTENHLLLTSFSLEEAEKLGRTLLIKREERQEKIKEILEEVEGRISEKSGEILVFEGNSSWSLTLLGSVASKICVLTGKLTFIFGSKEKTSRGAMRAPSGFNGLEIMKKCSKHLLTYGGHPPAAGFSIKNENLEKFKECLIKCGK